MRPRPLHVALFLLTAGFLVARLPVLPARIFDPDEFEHAHAAWLMWKGQVPYKDFFEHHTPWYYYVLRPFFNWFHVDASFESARHFLIAGRGLSFVLTALAAWLIYRIGRLWADARTGLVAALFFVAQPVVLQKTVEMRPDVLGLAFWCAGLLLLLRGLERRDDGTGPGWRWIAWAGLAVGAAIMCTQKMVFVLPGLLAGLGVWALAGATGATGGRPAIGSRLFAILVFLLAVAVPGALTWAWFALHQAGHEFIANNFLLNAQWKHGKGYPMRMVVASSRPILLVSAFGAALSLARLRRRAAVRPVDHAGLLLVATAAGLLIGLAVVPAAHRQYYLMPAPIICLFAAHGLLWVVDRARERLRPWLFGAAMIGLALKPIDALNDAYHEPNGEQLGRLRTVFDRTAPSDLVMDGWEGMGVFRPHAFFYFFLHDEARAMLPPGRLDAFLDDLEAGRIRPKLIVLDENLRALGPRFLAFVENRYARADDLFYFVPEPDDR